MKLRRRNKTCSTIFWVFKFTLPPVMIIFANDLDNIPNSESDASFFARNEVILCWIIFKLCSYIYLKKRVYKRHCDIITGTVLSVTGENFLCACSYIYCLQQAKEETEWQKHGWLSDSWKWNTPPSKQWRHMMLFWKQSSTYCKTWQQKWTRVINW